ncbi:MAG: helix-turn-helix transcriptional regulator [Planctomycetota bacterium]|jgi:DNA-binding PadR family transcriptional regulator
MSAQESISTLSLAILGLISQAPQSGYDLKKTFETTPMGHFSNSPGAIYPALGRLEKRGLIEGRVEKAQTLRPRKVYSLSGEGERALKAELRRPVTRKDVVWHTDDLMLRFAFMGHLLTHTEAIRFSEQFLVQLRSYTASLQEHLDAQRAAMPLHGRLAMEQGIESYRATSRWAERAVRELKAQKRG